MRVRSPVASRVTVAHVRSRHGSRGRRALRVTRPAAPHWAHTEVSGRGALKGVLYWWLIARDAYSTAYTGTPILERSDNSTRGSGSGP